MKVAYEQIGPTAYVILAQYPEAERFRDELRAVDYIELPLRILDQVMDGSV